MLWNVDAGQPHAIPLSTHMPVHADGVGFWALTRLEAALFCIAAAGATLLEKLHDELQQQGIQLGLCNPGQCSNIAEAAAASIATRPAAVATSWALYCRHKRPSDVACQQLTAG